MLQQQRYVSSVFDSQRISKTNRSTALLALDCNYHRSASTTSRARIQLHCRLVSLIRTLELVIYANNFQKVYIPRCLDQRLCGGRPHLASLRQIRTLDITLAHIPPHYRAISFGQHLPCTCSIYPTGWRLGCGWIPILCVPHCGCWRSSSWCSLLDSLDKDLAPSWRLQDRGRTNHYG